jgi:hypothetical protein
MTILLGDFNAEVGREDIFKLTIVNESLHEISNDNGVMLVFCQIRKPKSQTYDVLTSQHKPTIRLIIFW